MTSADASTETTGGAATPTTPGTPDGTTSSGHASAADPSVTPSQPHGVGARGAKGWFAGLDGLRAIAAFGVLLTHVGLASGYVNRSGAVAEYVSRGEVGVALFFVLSGFLLYRPFVTARLDGRPGPAVRRYLRSRFLRIFPAYWVALTVLAVILDTRELDEFTSPWEFLMYYGLLQSFSEVTAVGGLQQAWTLHNEIMFYLLLPFWAAAAAWLTSRLGSRRALSVELGVLAGAAVAALAWRMWVQSVRVDVTLDGFDPRLHWLIGNLHMFVPGMALALGYEWSRRQEHPLRILDVLRRHPMVCWAVAAASFWTASTRIGLGIQVGAESAGQDLGKEVLYAAVGFFMVAPVALAGSTLPRSLSWLSTRVMVTLGMLSYGIYLWHVGVIDIYRDIYDVPIFNGAFLPMLGAAAAGSVAVAAVSYVVVERPALKLKDPRRRRPAPPSAGEPVPTEAAAT